MLPAESADPIYSEFQDDEDFRELLEDFFSVANTRRETLAKSFAAGQINEIRTNAHQLKGSGGGYGFERLSELSAELEDACRQPEPSLDQIGPLLDDVIDYLARIRI